MFVKTAMTFLFTCYFYRQKFWSVRSLDLLASGRKVRYHLFRFLCVGRKETAGLDLSSSYLFLV